MNPIDRYLQLETRRQFFSRGAMGLGAAALTSLLPRGLMGDTASVQEMGMPGLPHFAPKAKRAIYLFMSGAPSQLDMFDYKPGMADWFDKELPETIRNGQRLTTMTSGQSRFPVAPSIYNFEKVDNGHDGAWISELLPHHKTIAGDIAIVKSVFTEAINHDPAITYICTGDQLPGKASLGSWLSYGLGSENENLPSFVVLNSTWTGRKEAQALYNRLWGSGFLPSQHQGVLMRTGKDPVLFLRNPDGVDPKMRRKMLDSLNQLNQGTFENFGDPEIQTRIAQYEMAFRMQTSVPDLVDISGESAKTLEMYGPDVNKPGTLAYNCLQARRLAERGVRFTQIFHRGWDQHGNLPVDLPNNCRDLDQPAAALIKDLKQRGMLEDTLVIWGGEFGRTIYCQGKLTKQTYGRDHHPRCFTMWMAGAGIKPGIVYGDTDEFGYNVTENPVHIHELNATILHQLGIDAEKFMYQNQGLDQRLIGVEPAKPVREIMI